MARSFQYQKVIGAVLLAAGCFVAADAALAAWNLIVTNRLVEQHPPPGRFYTVDGRLMYIYCVGEGSPTIFIESGLSSDSLGWYGVQRDLGRTTRVCAYDRSGLGLSEPRPDRRDSGSIARQLRSLLRQAGVEPPYVPVGWSAGGLYVREFAREFPGDIAGVVLIESRTPSQLEETPGFRDSWQAEIRDLSRQSRLERLRIWTGWERLMGRCKNSPSSELVSLPKDEFALLAGLYTAKTCRIEFVGGELGELVAFEDSSKQAGQLTSFGDVPLLIVTRDTAVSGKKSAADHFELAIWAREQDEMMSLSPKSWHVIARGSGHAVHHYRPELLVSEIRRLIDYLQSGKLPPFGTTTTR